jgi:predicted TIM-barrel fold metal-dependent hydrolase
MAKKLLLLLPFLLLIIAFSQTKLFVGEKKVIDTVEEQFYNPEDFTSVQKFDIHVHINTEEDYFMKQARVDNFKFLDIVVDRPFGLSMDEQQKIALLHLKNFSIRMAFATTFPVNNFASEEWTQNTITGLKDAFAKGAIAVKIWKNIGMNLRDKKGKFVMVDDVRLDPILDYLADNEIPLLGHNGEPRDCWLPLDEMTFSQGYYGAHPEYHMYLHPEYPSYQDQVDARDHMLEKHPDLTFMGAHLGSLEWSLEELAKRLDKFPNMYVDLTRMPNLQLHTLNNRQKTRDFFIKYQDRLIYGTDSQINPSSDIEASRKSIHNRWLREWKYYVTDEEITLEDFGTLKGLKLPTEVVDKIYAKNAMRLLDLQNW